MKVQKRATELIQSLAKIRVQPHQPVNWMFGRILNATRVLIGCVLLIPVLGTTNTLICDLPPRNQSHLSIEKN